MWKSWIPNSLSLGNLSFGFMSILISSSFADHPNQKEVLLICSLLILIAVLFDGFDGLIARLLKVESPLGEHLDTLADLTTFGIAPGFLVYQIHLQYLRSNVTYFPAPIPIGMFIASIYPLCVAYRLARFTLNDDKKSFIGLPSPISAALVVLILVLFEPRLGMVPSISVFLILSFLMVSNVKYTKPQIIFQDKMGVIRFSLLFVVLTLLLTFLFGWYMVALFVLILYTFSGLLALVFHFIQKFRV